MPGHSTRAVFTEWGVVAKIDEENEQFVLCVPFAVDELPYYPVLVAAIVAARSATAMYNAISRNLHGLAEDACEIEGVLHVHHDSLVQYIRARDATAQEILARKRATLKRVALRKTRPRKRPDKPVPVTASPTAAQLIEHGAMDFLDDLVKLDESEG